MEWDDDILNAMDPRHSYILRYLKGMNSMDQAAVATSAVPVVGDVLGTATDVSTLLLKH